MSNKRVKRKDLEKLIKECFEKSLSVNNLEKYDFEFSINSIYAKAEYKHIVTKDKEEKVIQKFQNLLRYYTSSNNLHVVSEPSLIKISDDLERKINVIIRINYDIIE